MENARERIAELRKQADDAQRALEGATREIRRIQAECRHQWSEPIYDPIVHEGYADPGDPPGTMGVDRRLPLIVPRSERKRWRRYCPLCDLTQYTDRTDAQVRERPKF